MLNIVLGKCICAQWQLLVSNSETLAPCSKQVEEYSAKLEKIIKKSSFSLNNFLNSCLIFYIIFKLLHIQGREKVGLQV